jgi:hypothetical protein
MTGLSKSRAGLVASSRPGQTTKNFMHATLKTHPAACGAIEAVREIFRRVDKATAGLLDAVDCTNELQEASNAFVLEHSKENADRLVTIAAKRALAGAAAESIRASLPELQRRIAADSVEAIAIAAETIAKAFEERAEQVGAEDMLKFRESRGQTPASVAVLAELNRRAEWAHQCAGTVRFGDVMAARGLFASAIGCPL